MAAFLPSTPTTFGPIQICGNISSVLWGVICVQTYLYSSRAEHDTYVTKALVAVVFCSETLITAILWEYFFAETVTHDLGPYWVPDTPWSLLASASFHLLGSSLVQAYFAHRVWAVSKRLYLALVAWAVILARIVVVSTTLTILGRTSVIFVVLEYRYLIDVSLALAIIGDFWTTTALCWHLWRAQKGAFRRTSSRIKAFMALTLETGIMTFVTALFTLISWVAAPTLGMWVGGLIVYARMYPISLLLQLNNRESHAPTGSSPRSDSDSPQVGVVHITRIREVEANLIELSSRSSSKQLSASESTAPRVVKNGGPFDQY